VPGEAEARSALFNHVSYERCTEGFTQRSEDGEGQLEGMKIESSLYMGISGLGAVSRRDV
jgi:hypothetical protein